MRLWDLHNRTAEPVVLRGHERGVSASVQQRWALAGQWQWDKRAAVGVAKPHPEPVAMRNHERASLGGSCVGMMGAVWRGSVQSAMGAGWPVAAEDSTVRLWDMHNRSAEPVVLRAGMSLGGLGW